MKVRIKTPDSPLIWELEQAHIRPEDKHTILSNINDRGFHLYKWISPEELRMSIRSDYLSIAAKSSIPLAIITVIAGMIGMIWGIIGIVLAIFGVLSVFYAMVAVILAVNMIRKGYLYTRGADVVITDHHLVSNGKIIEHDQLHQERAMFRSIETAFREPLFSRSELPQYIEFQKATMKEQLSLIFAHGTKIMQEITHGNHKNNGNITLVFVAAGILFSVMMALVYFIGVPFVYLTALIFTKVMHYILLASHHTEYAIQSRFQKIDATSTLLKARQESTVSLLTEAGRNEWVNNLSGRINASFAELNTLASISTKNSVELRHMLEQSQYKDIFNFGKYDAWIKRQILEPIDELIAVLGHHENIITEARSALSTQISNTDNPAHRAPLEAQDKRFELQYHEFVKMRTLLESYRHKLR